MTQGDDVSARPAAGRAGGAVIATYGLVVYGVFLVVFLYLVGFVADVDLKFGGIHVVGKSIDRGGGDGAVTATALVIDAALLALFGVQHSVMARPAFKRRWTRLIPPSAERSTYVMATNLCLIALIAAWPRSRGTCGG